MCETYIIILMISLNSLNNEYFLWLQNTSGGSKNYPEGDN